MKVTRILHVSVNVTGALESTRDFYADRLELGSAPRPTIPGVAGHWFSVGAAQLHLVDAPHHGAPAIDPTGPHVCFGVEDLDAAVRELDDASIPYEQGRQGDTLQIWITDPSGFTVELQQDPGAPAG
jgi:catechol 2,3-dioxygenase-like lactoylglutathione lyase family enzyme